MMRMLAGGRRVVVVNVRVPRAWEKANGTALAEGVRRYPNAVLVDWYAAGATHPGFFRVDGIHLRPAGARTDVALVVASMLAQ